MTTLPGNDVLCTRSSVVVTKRPLTVGADDSRGELDRRFLAAERFVMLALTQRHLAARALHAAQYHLRHVAAVPVPRLLGWGSDKKSIHQGRSIHTLQRKTDVHDSCLEHEQ